MVARATVVTRVQPVSVAAFRLWQWVLGLWQPMPDGGSVGVEGDEQP